MCDKWENDVVLPALLTITEIALFCRHYVFYMQIKIVAKSFLTLLILEDIVLHYVAYMAQATNTFSACS